MEIEEVKEVIESYGEEIEEIGERRLETKLDRSSYKEALSDLRDGGIHHLVSITGTDLGDEFEVLYHIECGDGTLLGVKVNVPEEDPDISTVTDIFPGAILYERELMEMLGVDVKDHPDPRRLFMAESMPEESHPLRKGGFDYQELSERSISEIKELSEEFDFDFEMLLEAERGNKDRKTLKEWLEGKIENPNSEEEE